MRRLARLLLVAGLLLGAAGCQLIVDFDRSEIPDAGVDGG